MWLLASQLAAGLLNIVMLAPVWIQLMHLLLADLVWIAWVFLAAETLASPAAFPAGAYAQPAAQRI